MESLKNNDIETVNMTPNNKPKKNRTGCFIIVVILLLLPVLGYLVASNYYYNAVNNPHTGSAAQVLIEIPEGSTIREIGQQLEDEELIEDGRIFEFYVRSQNIQSLFLAGTYETKGNRTLPDLIEDLQHPIEDEVKVTIPEGIRFTQIADRLDKVLTISPNWSKERFLELAETPSDTFSEYAILESKDPNASLEGFLFPDTYIFAIDVTTEDVIRKILDNTDAKISGDLLAQIEASEFTVYEVLNFAAMIERESLFSKDRPLVGDVLYKRYTENWKLGIDATLLYEHDDWKYLLTYEDLNKATPYNTRIHSGLPPTPIANPGLEAINGFVNREDNPYYFYLSDPEGNIYYAKTFAEHQANSVHLR